MTRSNELFRCPIRSNPSEPMGNRTACRADYRDFSTVQAPHSLREGLLRHMGYAQKVSWSAWRTSTQQCIKTANIQINIQQWDKTRLVLNSQTKTETQEQQLNPGGPDQRQSINPRPTKVKTSGRCHQVWGPPRPRAIKEGSKVVNCYWVNNEACSLLHNIHVVSGSFITNDYFPKLIRKNNFVRLFF